MKEVDVEVLRFLREDLEKTENWTYSPRLDEKFSEKVARLAIQRLTENKMVKYCACCCGGVMITPKGLEKIKQEPPLLVWKTKEGNVIRPSHMSTEHILNAITWLLEGNGTFSDLDDMYEGHCIGDWIKNLSAELADRCREE